MQYSDKEKLDMQIMAYTSWLNDTGYHGYLLMNEETLHTLAMMTPDTANEELKIYMSYPVEIDNDLREGQVIINSSKEVKE